MMRNFGVAAPGFGICNPEKCYVNARCGRYVHLIREDRRSYLIDKASSISLGSLAVSFARVQGGEEAVTEERFSHHVLPAANRLRRWRK
jgi:hypothetical protein